MDRIKGVNSRCLLGCNKRGCFSLPKNTELRQKWLDVLPKHPTSKWSMLCEDHFDPSQIIPKSINKQRILLKQGTVPSIFYIDRKFSKEELDLNNDDMEIKVEVLEDEFMEGCVNQSVFMNMNEDLDYEVPDQSIIEFVISFEDLVNNIDTKLRLIKNGWKRDLVGSKEEQEKSALVIYKLDLTSDVPCILAALKINEDLQLVTSIQQRIFPIKPCNGKLSYNFLQDVIHKLTLQNVKYMKEEDTSLPTEVQVSNVFQFLRKNKVATKKIESKMCRYCLLAEWNVGPDIFKTLSSSIKNVFESKYNSTITKEFPDWICLGCELKVMSFIELSQLASASEEIFVSNIGKFDEHQQDQEFRMKKEQEAIDSVMTKMVLEFGEDFVDDDDDEEYDNEEIEYLIKIETDDDEHNQVESVQESNVKSISSKRKSKQKNKALIKEATKAALSKAMKTINKGKKSRGIKISRECDLCGLVFEYRDVLIKHMKNYHMNNPVECSYCNKTFNGELKVKIHIKSVHELRHLCNICGQKFPLPSELKIHLSEKHGRKGEYICEICNSDFAVAWFLKRHMKTSHPDETSSIFMHVCDVCGKEFCTASAMKRHKSQVHNKMNSQKKDPLYGQCKHCGMKFDDPAELTQHTKQHTNIFPCDVCSRRFKTEGMLINHRKRHENEVRPWECNDCTRRYNTQQQLQVHIRREHQNDRTFECPQCNKMFYSAHEVKVHMKRHTISAEEILSCPLCDHKTKSYQNLRKHAFANHTNSRYKCPACGREYKQIKNFEEHVQREHDDLYSSGFCYKDYYVEDEAKMQHVLSLITYGGKERY